MLKKVANIIRNQGLAKLAYQISRRFNFCMVKPWGTTSGYTCPRPYFMVLIDQRGVDICCEGWIKVSLGRLSEKKGVPELWNNHAARAFRAAMLSTKLDRVCRTKVCPYIRRGDLPLMVDGRPQPNNPNTPTQLDKELTYPGVIEAMSQGKLKLDTLPQFVELSVDDRCNLHCQSCRKQPITSVSPETEKVMELCLKNMKRLAPTLRRLEMSGSGEVFFSPFSLKLLKSLNRQQSPHLWITILTNGQLLNEQTWAQIGPGAALIDKVKVSIDAASKEIYEQIRSGGKWNRLMENMAFMSSLRSNGSLKETVFNFVISDQNYHEMPEFVNLAKRFHVDRVVFTCIEAWPSMSFDYKKAAIHLPTHPENSEFRKVLLNPILEQPHVFIGIEREQIFERLHMKNQILSGKRFYNTNEATSHYLEKTDLFPKEEIAFSYITPHARILDLGCGTGRTTGYFKKNGYDVIAIDISTAMIRTAKNQNLAIPFLVGNASFLSIKSEIFDVVVFSFNGIDYIYPYAQRLKALQEIKRVLKPGGLFIFSSHNHCIPRDRHGVLPFFQFIFRKKRNTYINTFYAWGGMKMYLTTPTLQIKELNEMGFNPARIVTRRLLRHVKSLKFIGLIDNYVYYICRK